MTNDLKNVEYGLDKIFEGAQDFLPIFAEIAFCNKICLKRKHCAGGKTFFRGEQRPR